MKRLVMIVLMLGSLDIMAQDFAPLGAQWYYGSEGVYSSDKFFTHITSSKDTIIKGIRCRTLTRNSMGFGCYEMPCCPPIVYSRNDSVFMYENHLDEFELLYNFTANKGSRWYFRMYETLYHRIDTIAIFVDSTYSTIINNRNLKEQTVYYIPKGKSLNNFSPHSSSVIEGIGDLDYLFNLFILGACDDTYPSGLRCYEDNVLGYYHFPNEDSCTYTHFMDIKAVNQNPINIFPNPCIDEVYVSGLNKMMYYQIFELTGRVVKRDVLRDSKIVVSELPEGVYFLRLMDDEGKVLVNKVIIRQ